MVVYIEKLNIYKFNMMTLAATDAFTSVQNLQHLTLTPTSNIAVE